MWIEAIGCLFLVQSILIRISSMALLNIFSTYILFFKMESTSMFATIKLWSPTSTRSGVWADLSEELVADSYDALSSPASPVECELRRRQRNNQRKRKRLQHLRQAALHTRKQKTQSLMQRRNCLQQRKQNWRLSNMRSKLSSVSSMRRSVSDEDVAAAIRCGLAEP